MAVSDHLEIGAFPMIRTICTSICGAAIFLAAVVPVAILIIDKV